MASYQTLSDQVNICPAKPNSARQNLLYIISGKYTREKWMSELFHS